MGAYSKVLLSQDETSQPSDQLKGNATPKRSPPSPVLFSQQQPTHKGCQYSKQASSGKHCHCAAVRTSCRTICVDSLSRKYSLSLHRIAVKVVANPQYRLTAEELESSLERELRRSLVVGSTVAIIGPGDSSWLYRNGHRCS